MEPGGGEHRVPDLLAGDSLADVDVRLRWRYFHGFIQKASKFRRYLRDNRVQPEVPIPPIVEACFGVSYTALHDPTPRVGQEHKATNPKDIPNFFRPGNKKNEDISAVLTSAHHIKNSSEVRGLEPGRDFILVHNPNAKNPLPRGAIPLGKEFWVEDGVFCERTWRAPLD